MKTHIYLSLVLFTAMFAGVPAASAHCDTLSGPVIVDAREAIQRADVTPVLKWIRAADEPEIRQAFERTIRVRGASKEAALLADEFFFSTLVRVHRAGEGAPFTGLKATPPAAIEQASDDALETGEIDALASRVAAQLKEQIVRKAEEARELRGHAGHSVEAGRAYVAAYVDYIHFVEAAARLAEQEGAAHLEHAH